MAVYGLIFWNCNKHIKKGANVMNKQDTIKKLNFETLANRMTKEIPISEALKDITPIKWSDEVMSGKKQVNISKREK